MCPFLLQGEESTVLLDGNSEVGLMGSKVVRVSSVSGSLTIWAKCKRKKKGPEILLISGATMQNMINFLLFLFL